MLKQECFLTSTEYVPLAITCKTIYNTLLNHQHFSPSTTEKRLIEYAFIFQETQNIYSFPFRVTNKVKLSVFQCKIVHNILYKNKILHKIENKQQPDCPYCHGRRSNTNTVIWRMFTVLNRFRINLKWYNATCGGSIALEQNKLYMVF